MAVSYSIHIECQICLMIVHDYGVLSCFSVAQIYAFSRSNATDVAFFLYICAVASIKGATKGRYAITDGTHRKKTQASILAALPRNTNQNYTHMNFKDLCQARYSCRKYQALPIENDKLEYIRECVRLAPSAVNRQPWRFVLIDNSQPELFSLVKATYHRDWIDSVPAIILCMKNEAECWTRRYDDKPHADIDLAIAIEHLCLAATEQGLATCWVCNFDINQFHDTISQFPGLEPVALVPIGYAADEAPQKLRKDMADVWK